MIWSPLLENTGRVSEDLIHISDWLPTFANLAGVSIKGKIDGQNVWNTLSSGLPSPRLEALINIDKDEPYYSYIGGDYKYINGSRFNGLYDGYLSAKYSEEFDENFANNYGNSVLNSQASNEISRFSRGSLTSQRVEAIRSRATPTCKGKVPPSSGPSVCNPIKAPCLFNIVDDPCETTNIAHLNILEFTNLEKRAAAFAKIAEAPRNKPSDARANPVFFNYTWTWWFDVLGIPGKIIYIS